MGIQDRCVQKVRMSAEAAAVRKVERNKARNVHGLGHLVDLADLPESSFRGVRRGGAGRSKLGR
jgi:hypothetical protein